ncbi:NCS2 family permease [Lactovum miscens]|uniref:AGZA family xanthine/uracil permease-like MFS transporter n=1 Tax=Lactovum miscens TaxID=190387 RepID=A0A841CAE7_9LACT|nr:NCS2 family permease [Lactovum miscens]MBB5888369.1 AGZA family xanthine/uracil permease-like MFS transporter [Lactovum miscens]
MKKFFKLEENGTTVSREIMAGVTTFFAMSYILFVNPSVLHTTGMPIQGVFLATVIASVVGTVAIGLIANVPYALAPGMGLNAFFAYTVVLGMGYTWQQALAMVFICGIINIIITFTSLRKKIMLGIPMSLQHAIGGGIGVFIAYIGIKNAGLLQFIPDNGYVNKATGAFDSTMVPGLSSFNSPGVIVAILGIIITLFFVLRKIKGGVILSILATTIIYLIAITVFHTGHAIPNAYQLQSIDWSTLFSANSVGTAFHQMFVGSSKTPALFFAAFGNHGMLSLFSHSSKIFEVLMTILAFSLTSIFDPIGTFIGTGRSTGIFSEQDFKDMENTRGFSSKMDRALFADMIATPIGAIFGTSNTTVYVESTAGIGAGGRTGLTSMVVAVLFAISTFFLPLIGIVPTQATAPILIIVGMMMLSTMKDINWSDLSEAIPCFFASVFMGLSYSISYGIAFGFLTFIFVKLFTGRVKEVKAVVWIVGILFAINFAVLHM